MLTPPRAYQRLETMPLAEVEFGAEAARLIQLLTDAGVRTLGQLWSMSESELAAIPGMGPKRIEMVKEILAQFGCPPLRDDTASPAADANT